jgi:hypothetical protein
MVRGGTCRERWGRSPAASGSVSFATSTPLGTDNIFQGDFMGKRRDLVITAYGHDRVIDTISASAFDQDDSHDVHDSNAKTYCGNINALELKGNSWVFATVVSENTQYALDSFLPLKFDVLLNLDDASVQKVLREVDLLDLARALKDTEESTKVKIFSNVSKRVAQMLKEEMELMGPIRTSDGKKSQEKIVSIIRRLEEAGEIIINYSKGDTVS